MSASAELSGFVAALRTEAPPPAVVARPRLLGPDLVGLPRIRGVAW